MNPAHLHRFCAIGLVACGDGADHDGHPEAVSALAFRTLAHTGALVAQGVAAEVEHPILRFVAARARWDLHEAVLRIIPNPFPDPSCDCCRVRFGMFLIHDREEEEARQERIDALLAP